MVSKSQTTVEFMIILAIVLVIITIVLLMVNPFQTFLNNNEDSEIFWNSGLIGMHVLEFGTVNAITLENNLPSAATIKNVTFTTDQEFLIIEDQYFEENKKTQYSFTDPTSCTSGDILIGTIQIIYNTTEYFEETLTFENKRYEVTCN